MSPFPPRILPHLPNNRSNNLGILLVHGAFTNKDPWKPVLALLPHPHHHFLIPTSRATTIPKPPPTPTPPSNIKALTFPQTYSKTFSLSQPLHATWTLPTAAT